MIRLRYKLKNWPLNDTLEGWSRKQREEWSAIKKGKDSSCKNMKEQLHSCKSCKKMAVGLDSMWCWMKYSDPDRFVHFPLKVGKHACQAWKPANIFQRYLLNREVKPREDWY